MDRLGEGLLVSGHSMLDELVEAIERPDRRFVLGVQWHPEVDPASTVIAAFVAACGEAMIAEEDASSRAAGAGRDGRAEVAAKRQGAPS